MVLANIGRGQSWLCTTPPLSCAFLTTEDAPPHHLAAPKGGYTLFPFLFSRSLPRLARRWRALV